MAEPEAKPDGLPSLSQQLQPFASSSSQEGKFHQVFANPAIEPTDDSPTVISRVPQTHISTEEMLAGVLRGKQLSHFELLEPIGVGGMAAVIRARDTQLDRTVALKILPPEMARDPENVRRFHQEARAAAKLDHENIARVFFCGEDQGLHFIAFEFVAGENLRTLLEQRGRLPVPEAIGYMLQIATGLVHAAARGVVHRDIKPSNIIISPGGRTKLVDMGLARSLAPQTDQDLTQSGVTLGTFDYISPEQALEPRQADIRSDIYSLGCTSYHMLTGQPPVPDGTAAKKLHHHQHVNPVDPRQLNPDIPDEVAALLGRMMAKEPKDRYQQPEELVQQLVALARKVGAVSAIPEGILFVDGPLPGPTRIRPRVIAVCALLGLVALVALLGPAPWPSAKPSTNPVAARSREPDSDNNADLPPAAADKAEPMKDAPNLTPKVQDQVTQFSHPEDAKGFAELLRNSKTARVQLGKDFNLTYGDQLVFAGEDLLIESADPDPNRMPTIRLRYDPLQVEGVWAALTIKSGTVRIRGIRFELDPHEAQIAMTALNLRGGRLIVDSCEFVQKDPPPVSDQGYISAITAVGSPGSADLPALTLHGCYFDPGGQYALTVTGGATTILKHCAFAPQTGALVDFHPGGDIGFNPDCSLKLVNCSAILGGQAIFRLRERAFCPLIVENCIFSRPSNDLGVQDTPALVEQSGNTPFRYSGSGNRYHNLGCYWASYQEGQRREVISDFNTFRRRFGVEDERSLELAVSPWDHPEPLQFLRSNQPFDAFSLRNELPELRVKDREELVGVASVLGNTYSKPGRVEKPTAELHNQDVKIVDPMIAISKENTYQTLRQALEYAKPRDTILIKHKGLLKVDPVRLEKAGTDITIKPFPGYRPILTIGQTTEPDAALFRVYDSQLKLEQLEFHLLPGRSEFKAQTVVAMMGDGQCSFQGCVATLEETPQVPLSFITLGDPSGVMKMGPPPAGQQSPRLIIEGCFVRGAADFMAVRASRPFELRIEQTLIALDGSVLLVDGNPRDLTGRPRAEVSLKQVTAYLNDHLVWLRTSKEEGKINKGLVLTQIRPVADCLFVSANGKPLIHLDGIDSDDQMKRLFSWGESRHNAYSNFTWLLEEKPWAEGGMMAPPSYGKAQWEDFSQEENGRFERMKLIAPFGSSLPLAKMVPADFKVREERNSQKYGADIERLPVPAESSSPAESAPDN